MQIIRGPVWKCIAGTILLALSPGIWANAQASQSSPLAGITRFKVAVNLVPSTGIPGITEDRIRTITELKLRLAGIRVLSEGEDPSHYSANPYLLVFLNVSAHSACFAYDLTVSLRHPVASPIDGRREHAVIWEQVFLSTTTSDSLSAAVTDKLGEILDDFVNQFLAAHPRR